MGGFSWVALLSPWGEGIYDWYLRLVNGLEQVVDASAGDSEEGLYDSEGPPGIFAASHIFRGGALQAAVAACSSCEPW